jgi:hypothetical protein
LGGGKGDDPRHLLVVKEAQQVDAVAGNSAIVREADDGHIGLVRQRGDRRGRAGEQRAEDDLGTGGDRFRGGGAGTVLGASVVPDDELEPRLVEIEDGELGGLLHRLGDGGGLRIGGRRQQQGDLDRIARRPGPARGQRSGGSARSGTPSEQPRQRQRRRGQSHGAKY